LLIFITLSFYRVMKLYTIRIILSSILYNFIILIRSWKQTQPALKVNRSVHWKIAGGVHGYFEFYLADNLKGCSKGKMQKFDVSISRNFLAKNKLARL